MVSAKTLNDSKQYLCQLQDLPHIDTSGFSQNTHLLSIRPDLFAGRLEDVG